LRGHRMAAGLCITARRDGEWKIWMMAIAS
jgi:hypothetical protein